MCNSLAFVLILAGVFILVIVLVGWENEAQKVLYLVAGCSISAAGVTALDNMPRLRDSASDDETE